MASRGAEVWLDWAGERRRFALRIGEIRQLEDERGGDGGIVILKRLISSGWKLDDARATLRLALEGGGMEPGAALRLVRRYFDEQRETWLESAKVAALALNAAFNMKAAEEIPTEPPDPNGSAPQEAVASPSAKSTRPEPSSADGPQSNATS